MIIALLLNPVLEKICKLDCLYYGTKNYCNEVVEAPFGSGIVIARVAKELGKDVLVCGFIGKAVGDSIKKKLQQEGIYTDFTRIEDSSRRVLTIIERDKKQQLMIIDPFPHVSEQELLRFEKKLNKHIEKSNIIIISGSVPLGIPANFYASLVKNLKQKGKDIILDSRGDVHSFEAIKGNPYMVKLDYNQIREVSKIDSPSFDKILDIAFELHSGGINIVVVSLEEKGALIVYDKEAYHAIPPKIKNPNIFGNGDSFIAGFAVGVSQNKTMNDTIKLAMACASANAMSTLHGHVSYHDIEKNIGLIKINGLRN